MVHSFQVELSCSRGSVSHRMFQLHRPLSFDKLKNTEKLSLDRGGSVDEGLRTWPKHPV